MFPEQVNIGRRGRAKKLKQGSVNFQIYYCQIKWSRLNCSKLE